MTLSWPSFSAAAISPFIPPKAAADVALEALTVLALLVPLLALPLLEPEEPQPTVSSRLPNLG
jgi:hypothetical protein